MGLIFDIVVPNFYYYFIIKPLEENNITKIHEDSDIFLSY